MYRCSWEGYDRICGEIPCFETSGANIRVRWKRDETMESTVSATIDCTLDTKDVPAIQTADEGLEFGFLKVPVQEFLLDTGRVKRKTFLILPPQNIRFNSIVKVFHEFVG